MAAAHYVADPAALLPSVAMEGFAVVHHVPSGITHLLAPPAPEILAALSPQHGPADLVQLIARLTRDYDLDGEAELAIAARLDELERAGLVRRVTGADGPR